MSRLELSPNRGQRDRLHSNPVLRFLRLLAANIPIYERRIGTIRPTLDASRPDTKKAGSAIPPYN